MMRLVAFSILILLIISSYHHIIVDAKEEEIDLITLLAGLGRVAQESDRQASLESAGNTLSSHSHSDPDDPNCPLHDVCPVQHTRHPKKNHVPWSNGCGAAGMNLKDGWGLTKCCDEHDYCYSTCNTKRSKCDNDFAKCMEQICATVKGKKNREECSSTAGMYNFGASGFGCTSFIESQKEACDCIPEEGFLPAPAAETGAEETTQSENESDSDRTPPHVKPQSKPPTKHGRGRGPLKATKKPSAATAAAAAAPKKYISSSTDTAKSADHPRHNLRKKQPVKPKAHESVGMRQAKLSRKYRDEMR